MSEPAFQLDLLDTPPAGPPGFVYRADLISVEMEAALITEIEKLDLREFEFHGYLGKRRVVSFGLHYDFAERAVHRSEPIPEFLLPLRDKAAAFADQPPAALEHALVLEYTPSAAIGWHRDRPIFGDVIGVSLASACRFRFRRLAPSPSMGEARGGGALLASRSSSGLAAAGSPPPNPPPSRGRALVWQRQAVRLEPRSAYLLRGPVRDEWEHSIPPAEELRYSITFRTMRGS
jgi:alkylated DNA repair dioxygenase AlkB